MVVSAMTLSHLCRFACTDGCVSDSRRSVWCTFGVASVKRCEALLFPRYFIVVRTAFAPFGNVCLHPCHCALRFTIGSCCVTFVADAILSKDFPSLESIEE